MIRSCKVRVYLTKAQESLSLIHFGNVRFVKNWIIEQHRAIFHATKDLRQEDRSEHFINEFSVNLQLPGLKEQFPFLKASNAQSLQQASKETVGAFKHFYQGKGFPKFRGKHDRQSISYPQRVKLDLDHHKISLPKFGYVKYRGEITMEDGDVVKTTKLIREPSGKYYVSMVIENEKAYPELPPVNTNEIIGVDSGLLDAFVTSLGQRIKPPKFFKKSQEKLAKLQRILSKKVRGSNRYNQIKLKIARLHEHIRYQREYWQHQVANKLVHDNQGTCWEDLKISNMMKNHCLAKAIQDVGWYGVKTKTRYKSKNLGKHFFECNPRDPTSKMCFCGHKQELTLGDRSWICEQCHVLHDRDIHAANMIKFFALKKAHVMCPYMTTDADVSVLVQSS